MTETHFAFFLKIKRYISFANKKGMHLKDEYTYMYTIIYDWNLF